jgi:hypothetical protein
MEDDAGDWVCTIGDLGPLVGGEKSGQIAVAGGEHGEAC